eukprot:CAMPEP_0179002638 /NCGR_PEP_ID=MMETSP0795-20121207/12168_1 /TAXON_ID=88552 /ORGANISM="Amoebophrya sp., Strain Ameob2" /LENGTH=72 /DNA_ID=CAMNT_0020696427 /DNA_START=44 /DNA_END=258 /DNA_ORIENTATION=-
MTRERQAKDQRRQMRVAVVLKLHPKTSKTCYARHRLGEPFSVVESPRSTPGEEAPEIDSCDAASTSAPAVLL